MSFAGKPTEEAQGVIANAIKLMVASALAVIVGVIVLVFVVARHMTKLMKNSTDLISEVSQGNFTVTADKKVSGDEIGDIYKQAGALAESLRNVVEHIKIIAAKLSDMSAEMSQSTNTVSSNTNEINRAAEEVAEGAMEQAESVQKASVNMDNVNKVLAAIQEQINGLNAISGSMQTIEEKVMQYIDTLTSISKTTNEELAEVEDKVAKTSEAINNIQKATELIRNIASETKLLSLNASIEAARAGEAGKGFAVVAEEVSKLAQESDSASGDIEEILEALRASAEDMTNSVKKLSANMGKQTESITDTYEEMTVLDGNIRNVVKSIEVISESCKEAKELSDAVGDIISSLSATSQQNAAACEETNASVQELNATITSLSEEASVLNKIAEALVNEVAIFKV